MITRRRFIVGAGTAGALGVALRVPAGGRASAPASAPGAAAAGGGVVLEIVQAGAGVAPARAGDVPLLWRLGACEILDPRRLDERLARWPAARIRAVVDGGNHLLLVDALRHHGGAILKERWSPAEQRWTLIARTGRTSAR